MLRRLVPLVAVLAVVGCGSSRQSASELAPVHGKYAPTIEASNFVSKVDNPLWPLRPGAAADVELAAKNLDRTQVGCRVADEGAAGRPKRRRRGAQSKDWLFPR